MALVISESNYEEIVSSGKPILIDFWAEWCGPCRQIGPVVEELSHEYEGRIVIGKCDVDNNQDISVKYGIRNIPTLLFFKNGEVVDRLVGAVGKDKITAKLNSLL